MRTCHHARSGVPRSYSADASRVRRSVLLAGRLRMGGVVGREESSRAQAHTFLAPRLLHCSMRSSHCRWRQWTYMNEHCCCSWRLGGCCRWSLPRPSRIRRLLRWASWHCCCSHHSCLSLRLHLEQQAAPTDRQGQTPCECRTPWSRLTQPLPAAYLQNRIALGFLWIRFAPILQGCGPLPAHAS